jgi:hypothetical protein
MVFGFKEVDLFINVAVILDHKHANLLLLEHQGFSKGTVTQYINCFGITSSID